MKNKNIWILPTDKPSRLYLFEERLILGDLVTVTFKNSGAVNQNIYITSDEEIKDGDWFIDNNNQISRSYRLSQVKFANPKKIILTTDTDIIKDGVQDIDDEFLEWICKNPSCEEVGVEQLPLFKKPVYKIIIPKEEALYDYGWCKGNVIFPKEELSKDKSDKFFVNMVCNPKEEPKQRLEKYSERFDNKENEVVEGIFDSENWGNRMVKQETLEEEELKIMLKEANNQTTCASERMGFILGAKWQQEKNKDVYLDGYVDGSRNQAKLMYSEEELKKYGEFCVAKFNGFESVSLNDDIFEQFKKK